MHPADFTIVPIAAVSAGLYVAWLVAFERALEPFARRLLGALIGCPIVWVPAGLFRAWGSGEAGHEARDGLIAAMGTLLVLAAAAVPVVALHFAARLLEPEREGIRASAYLMTAPLMMVFLIWVARRRGSADGAWP
ncbi:MAG: hypothetical protein ACLP1X_04400 [Polyangiaceae bacterium]|jgi:hypothetical protein